MTSTNLGKWPLFYAAHIQTLMWDRLGVLLTKSELVHILVAGDLAIPAGEVGGDWPPVYASRVREFATAKGE